MTQKIFSNRCKAQLLDIVVRVLSRCSWLGLGWFVNVLGGSWMVHGRFLVPGSCFMVVDGWFMVVSWLVPWLVIAASLRGPTVDPRRERVAH